MDQEHSQKAHKISECLALLHIQEKHISALLLGKDCVDDKPAHISQGVWSFYCWLQLKTPSKTAKPKLKSFVNLLRGKCLNFRFTHPQISFLIPTLWFHVFSAFWRSCVLEIPAGADTHAKAVTPTWCLQHYIRTSQPETQLLRLLRKLTQGSHIPGNSAGCCICSRGAVQRFFHS